MSIKSSIVTEATSKELNSPQFLENKSICEIWEEYIGEKKGSCRGKCNVWALVFHEKFDSNQYVEVKFNSNVLTSPNLFIKSETTTVESSEILISGVTLRLNRFTVKRESAIGNIMLKYNSNYNKLVDGYISSQDLKSYSTYIKTIIYKLKNFKVTLITFDRKEEKLYIKCNRILKYPSFLDEILRLNID